MWFTNFESLCGILILIVLVRIVLNRCNFTTLVNVCLTGFLSFVLFESFWSLSPLVWYLLKEPILDLLTSLKTFFFNLKRFLFLGDKEGEKDPLLPIQGKNLVPITPDKDPNLVDADSQSTSWEDLATLPIPPTTCDSSLSIKDKGNIFSLHNDLLPCLASPLEKLPEKEQYFQWAGFWLCVGLLFTTSRAAFGVLRRLPFTQELVKRMIDLGCPKWTLCWLAYSNPRPLPDEPVFYLMLCILIGNLVILYTLMKMIYIIS